jgi:hypothetical protein
MTEKSERSEVLELFVIPQIFNVVVADEAPDIPTDVIEAIEGTILSGLEVLDELIEDRRPLLAEDVAEYADLDPAAWSVQAVWGATEYALYHQGALVMTFEVRPARDPWGIERTCDYRGALKGCHSLRCPVHGLTRDTVLTPLGDLRRRWWGGWTFGPVSTQTASKVAVWKMCREAGKTVGIPEHAWTAVHGKDAWLYITAGPEDQEKREKARLASAKGGM